MKHGRILQLLIVPGEYLGFILVFSKIFPMIEFEGAKLCSSYLNVSKCSSYRFVALNYGILSKSLEVHAAWP